MAHNEVTETSQLETRAGSAAYRTGPTGRLVRTGLLAVMVLSLISLLDQGGVVSFRRPSVPGELSVWFLTFVMAALFVSLAGIVGRGLSRRPAEHWQLGAIVILGGSAAAAAIVGYLSAGTVWGFPLADLVWGLDVVMLVQTIVALAVAIVLGTPGCEIGVWGELLGRQRVEPTRPLTVSCVVGLHLLDSLEARHRARSRGDVGTPTTP